MQTRAPYLFALIAAILPGCRDVDRLSTNAAESYCGQIVAAKIVREGFDDDVCLRMTLDTDRLAESPGAVWTSDGLFTATPLRPIPQLSHDPLLTFTFGEGREKNLLFAIDPVDATRGPTLTAVISLMHTGETEMRLLRGAPGAPPSNVDAGAASGQIFGVFAPLKREEGACLAHAACKWVP